MSEAIAIFNYNGIKTTIQCFIDEKMSIVCEKFERKVGLDLTENYYYLYNGNIINKDLKFAKIVNEIDKKSRTMNIVVDKLNRAIINRNIKESEEIICPQCKGNILIKIENYRVSLYKL